jgi:hypothetical protein
VPSEAKRLGRSLADHRAIPARNQALIVERAVAEEICRLFITSRVNQMAWQPVESIGLQLFLLFPCARTRLNQTFLPPFQVSGKCVAQ